MLALGATNAVAELKQQPVAPSAAAALEQRLEAIEKTVQRAPEMPAAAVSRVEDKVALSKVKVGDKVDITWTAAALVSIDDVAAKK